MGALWCSKYGDSVESGQRRPKMSGKQSLNWAEQNTSVRKCRRLAIPQYPEQHGQGESGNTLQPDRGALPDQAIDPFRL